MENNDLSKIITLNQRILDVQFINKNGMPKFTLDVCGRVCVQ